MICECPRKSTVASPTTAHHCFLHPQKTALNLSEEGIPKQRIKLSGDTMYDALLQHMPAVARSIILNKLSLKSDVYAALTLHRPENVDTPKKLKNILKAMIMLKESTIVFPVHPRTRQLLTALKMTDQIEEAKNIKLVPIYSLVATLRELLMPREK